MPFKDKNKKREAQKEADAKRAGRTRNFATLVYATKEYLDRIGSAYDGSDGYGTPPENWMEIVSDLHVPVLISPLHGHCKNPDGTIKKPHWHILFMFDNVKNWEKQVKPMFESFGGVGREEVNSLRGYARYLCHLDNAEKTQYNPVDIISYGGADYDALVHLPTDDLEILKEIFLYIRTNKTHSFAEFLDICATNNKDWFSVVSMSRGYIVDKYIKSLAWEEQNGYVRKKEKTIHK